LRKKRVKRGIVSAKEKTMGKRGSSPLLKRGQDKRHQSKILLRSREILFLKGNPEFSYGKVEYHTPDPAS